MAPLSFKALSLAVLSLAQLAAAVDKTVNPELDIQLEQAPTNLDKMALLSNESDWVFDFFKQPVYNYSPGALVNANAATFPVTVGNGMTMTWVAMGPCGMQPPHYHPRASNYIVVVEGTVQTYMIPENGGKMISVTLEKGQMSVFPKGSLHAMQNKGCGNATLISALSTEDPGTHNIVNGLFGLPAEMIQAAFGLNSAFSNLDAINSSIPAVGTGVVLGAETCRSMCQMK